MQGEEARPGYRPGFCMFRAIDDNGRAPMGAPSGATSAGHPQVLEKLTTIAPVGIFSNMTAVALIRRRVVLSADAFVEVVVWRVPEPVPPSAHAFKYRLAYVVAGECVLRYDNERDQGDHRHVGTVESPYGFSTPDRLLADFTAEIARWNREHGRS